MKKLFFIIIFSPLLVIPSPFLTKVLTEKELSFLKIVEPTIKSGADGLVRKVSDGINTFVIKQIKKSSCEDQFSLIVDATASNMATHLGVPVNNVFFIPYNAGAHLKLYPNRAATLHSYVTIADNREDFQTHFPFILNIDQIIIDPVFLWQKKWPPLPSEEGLTQEKIEAMSFHSDLPSLCALDTFIGNYDRSWENLSYNPTTNRFCGIDQGSSFTKNLAPLTYRRVKELEKKGYFQNCSKQVITSLYAYRNTLQKLTVTYSPASIIQNMAQLVTYLGIDDPKQNYIPGLLRRYTALIEQNYLDILQLLNLLDTILGSLNHN